MHHEKVQRCAESCLSEECGAYLFSVSLRNVKSFIMSRLNLLNGVTLRIRELPLELDEHVH